MVQYFSQTEDTNNWIYARDICYYSKYEKCIISNQ